ncbi:ABC transporter related protein [Paenibacillus vortex V453]|uniref:ABC transporter related protein n=1 Tax=Paenibacillus vortex V453 TaxID=715225 RepID=A0A2R9SVA9_9BACL|nr:ABC transporter related protein [Paenibacillus vortex V453]
MIKVDRLKKTMGPERTPVLKDITFQMEHGEMIGLIGASGSGKSLMMSCLSMQQKWDGGKLTIDGEDMMNPAGKRRIRREWAYLEQNPALNVNRTALKNVLIGQSSQTPMWRMVTGMVRSDDYMGAMDTIEHLGLLDKAKRKAGEAQRRREAANCHCTGTGPRGQGYIGRRTGDGARSGLGRTRVEDP